MSDGPGKEPSLYCIDEEMRSPTGSPIIQLAGRGFFPFILLVGLYVFFHGHYSPGGGFQGGVLMASAVLLLRLTHGTGLSQAVMPTGITLRLSAVGGMIFAGTGLVTLFFGGNFLDYHFLPAPWLEPEHLRYYGILLIELGVIVTVMTTLVAIYDDLLGC